MSRNKQKDTCLACNKGFTKTDASIQCTLCGLWIHHKPCSTISDEGFKFLSEQLQATGHAYWACRSCICYSQGITQRVREVEKKLDEIQAEVKDNAKVINKVDKSVEELRQELEKVKSSKAHEANNLMTTEEYREREARRQNVILHRVPETEATTAEARKQADLTVCYNIFSTVGLQEWTSDIKICRRLGEKMTVRGH
jgi:hypothetical protein